MKNKLGIRFLSILALAQIANIRAESNARNYQTGTFFSVRPFTDTLSAQDLMLDKEHGTGKVKKQRNIQLTAFVSRSTEEERLARYFSQGKKSLIVKEEAPDGNNSLEYGQDILARDFNIITNGHFKSTITLKPRQTVYGGTFSLRSYMGKSGQWSWAMEMPFLRVRNDLHMTEDFGGATFTASANTTLVDQKQVVGSMAEAFRQTNMKYGKINGPRSKSGIGNIVLKLGYEPCAFCHSDDKYMNMYFGVILPTDNKPKAEYMFEPILGNGGHTGLMMGTTYEALMRSGERYNFWSRWNVESRYLFENTQKRSFDLVGNGLWSRYLPMYENDTQRNNAIPTFGINLLTRDAKVRPGLQCMIDGSFCVAGEKWHASLGSSTFARQTERVELAQAWNITPSIASYAAPGSTNRTRQSGREYGQNDEAGATDLAIVQADIDLGSAAHPANVSQMVYATFGGYKEAKKSCMYEVGAAYEFSCLNTSLNRWGAWATLQFSF